MLDANKIKDFWLKRGLKENEVAFESIANLEENPHLLALKIRLEQEQVLPRLALHPDLDVLDLGCGNGQWSLRFASQVRSVTAVDYSVSLLEIGKKKACSQNITNIRWVESPAETFAPERQWPLIFISGLFVYLTDEQADAVLEVVSGSLARGGKVFLRDGTSVLGHRHYLDDIFSPVLQTSYSAIYRTAEEYKQLFKSINLSCTDEGNMFADGIQLNKYPETRLRFYEFKEQ